MSAAPPRAGLVTGAGSGIGRACALRLAAAGAYVAVADVDAAGGEETVALIRAAGGEGAFVRCDVTAAADVEALVAHVVGHAGRIDFAHNNAGILPRTHPLEQGEEAEWDRVMGVNVKGAWLCLKHELAAMRAQGGGAAIVNTASISSFFVPPFLHPYATSKHAIVGMTKEAAAEVARHGIRVNAVAPGHVDTALSRRHLTPAGRAAYEATIPMGRYAAPEEIAEAVAWLLSDAAGYVTGQTLAVDGGLLAAMPQPGQEDA